MKKILILFFTPIVLLAQAENSLPFDKYNCSLFLTLVAYNDMEVIDSHSFAIQRDQDEWKTDFNGGRWRIVVSLEREQNGLFNITCDVTLENGLCEQTAVQLEAIIDNWNVGNYVLLPGAVYDGNRFTSLPMAYPPLMDNPTYFHPKLPITISNVPRLNTWIGESKIEQTTGDPATPAMGFFSASEKQMMWLLTGQRTRFGNSGLTVEESDSRAQCTFSITAPAMRKQRQTMVNQVLSDDRAPDWQAGDSLQLKARLYVDRAKTVQDLFDRFVEIRQDLTGPAKLTHQLPFHAAFDIQQKKYNEQNWDESRGYYSVGMRENMAQDWQLGWVGGLMATLPLLANGDSLSVERAIQNIETIISKTQAPSGFYYGIGNGTNWHGDGFTTPHPHNMHMVRKSADALYYLSKQFLLMEKLNPEWHCPDQWRQALMDLADAFVKLWDEYGQFGQFVDVETGKMLVYGSTAGALAPGGLALAAHYLREDSYLRVAEKSAQFYYNRDVKNGLTTGGPGEILQCPDSESAFALLESFVTLYVITGKSKYKDMAVAMAKQCATWVVSYDYLFPQESLFGRLDMKSAGSVIANVQNKHSAPGICTLSGNSLLHLYRATADPFYLNVLRDISHNITQYLSREDRPVGDMPPGWMNERVNLSDWEGADKVGDIFHGSTWAEVACLLTATEIPSVYLQLRDWNIWTFDHLDVEVVKKNRFGVTLKVTNPTAFASTYSFLIEDARQTKEKLNPVYFTDFKKVRLEAGQSKNIRITYKRFIIENDVQRLPLPEYREIRIPRKTSAYVMPALYWIAGDEPPYSVYSLEMGSRISSLYKPSNAPVRFGATFSAGANFLVSTGPEFPVFFPFTFASIGPEFRFLKNIYVYPNAGNILFPFSLFADMWLFYSSVEVGVRLPLSEKRNLFINYSSKALFQHYDGEWNETPPLIKNVSIGFQF